MKKRKESVLLVCIIVVLIGGVLMAGCISPPEEGSKELPQEIVIGIGEDIKGLEPVFGTPWVHHSARFMRR